ncbi:MAG TPA: hypothetical protein VGH89_14915 [Pseudonocardia sp.]|jgi:hypothetical protein
MYGSNKRGFAAAVITGGLIGVSGTSAALRSNPPVAPVAPARPRDPESNSFQAAGQRSASEAAVDRIGSSADGLGDPGRSVQVDFGQSGPRVNGGRPAFGERPRGDEHRQNGLPRPGSGGLGSGGPGSGGLGSGGPGSGVFGASGPAGSAFGGQRAAGPEFGGSAFRGSEFGGPASGGPGFGGPVSGGSGFGGPASGGPASGGPASGGPASGGPGSGAAGGDDLMYGRSGSARPEFGGPEFAGPSMYRAAHRSSAERSELSAAGPSGEASQHGYGSDASRPDTGATRRDFSAEREPGDELTARVQDDDVRRTLPGDEPIRTGYRGESPERRREFGSADRGRPSGLDDSPSPSVHRGPEPGSAPHNQSHQPTPAAYSFGATAERANLDDLPRAAELSRHGSGALRAVPDGSESGGRRHAPESPAGPESRPTGTGSHRAVAGSGSYRTVAELVSASGAQPVVPTGGPGRRARPDDSSGYGGLRVVPNVDEPRGYTSVPEVPALLGSGEYVRPAERTGTGGFQSISQATGTDGYRAVSPARAADAGMGALGPAEGSLGTGFHAYGDAAPEVELGRGTQRPARSRMFIDRAIESSLPNAAVVSRQFAADRPASDRGAGQDAPYRRAEQEARYGRADQETPYRRADQEALYRPADQDTSYPSTASGEFHRDALGRRDQHLAEPRHPGHDAPVPVRPDSSALGSLDSSGFFSSLGRRSGPNDN